MIKDKDYLLIGVSAWVSSLSSFFMIRTVPTGASLFQALLPSGLTVLIVTVCILVLLKVFKVA